MIFFELLLGRCSCELIHVTPYQIWILSKSVLCGCVMSPTSDIYWVKLRFINNYKEIQL